MKILFAISEYHPLIRTDDIADFAASLTKAIGQLSHDIRVILPGYPEAVNAAVPVETVTTLEFAGYEDTVRLLKGRIQGIDFPVYLVEAPALFSRHGHPYITVEGKRRKDNLSRFVMFSQAVSMIALNHAGLNWKPDIVHCNDWQTGLIPALLAQDWNRPATVFSCHHISDQDNFDLSELNGLKLPSELKTSSNCQVEGRFSPLKSGLMYSDTVVTTDRAPGSVHSEYINALASRDERVKVVYPALDESRWNPASDKFIAQPYDTSTFDLKLHNKKKLQNIQNLEDNDRACLISIFGDITDDEDNPHQLQLTFIEKLLAHEQVQLLLHCRKNQTGKIEVNLKQHYDGRLALCNNITEKELHRMIAGSDAVIFPHSSLVTRLMPQVCCRYGTVPMLSRQPTEILLMTEATSENLMKGRATGFFFTDNSADSMYDIAEKLVKYHGRSGPWWKKLAVNCMQEFAVNHQARLEFTQQYLECYQFAIDNPASNPDH
jgi:starch synthase